MAYAMLSIAVDNSCEFHFMFGTDLLEFCLGLNFELYTVNHLTRQRGQKNNTQSTLTEFIKCLPMGKSAKNPLEKRTRQISDLNFQWDFSLFL